jgi:hypothetical protein
LADLFHTACLEKLYSALPDFTAPLGYTCPTCSIPIWTDKETPIASQVRLKLGSAPWAKRIASMTASVNGNAGETIGIGYSQPVPNTTVAPPDAILNMPRKQASSMQLDADDDKYSKASDSSWMELFRPRGRMTAKRIIIYLLIIAFVLGGMKYSQNGKVMRSSGRSADWDEEE